MSEVSIQLQKLLTRQWLIFVGVTFCLLFQFMPSSFAQVGPNLSPDILVYPRHAGRPDPRWRDFNWRFTERTVGETGFRFLFYESEEWAARFALPLVEEQIRDLTETFSFAPRERFDYALFTSLEEFREANIFFVSEGVRGITSTQEATMALPYVGDPEDFDHVSRHEMVHQFQTQKARALAGESYGRVLERTPLWFIEGMAEYISLNGMDADARFYIRDLLLHPNGKEKYEMPGFFESGPLSFVFVYKVGQGKIDFLNRNFGVDTSQRIYNRLIEEKGLRPFEAVTIEIAGRSKDEIESLWRSDLEKVYLAEANSLGQPLDFFEEVLNVGENIDIFEISPSGEALVIREVNPLTGITTLQLMSLSGGRKTALVRDQHESTVGLYFMQGPTFAISDSQIAYFLETPGGPELEIVSYEKNGDAFSLGDPQRAKLDNGRIRRATSPSFSPDGESLAFVGLDPSGWQSLYRLSVTQPENISRVLHSHFTWRSLSWFQDRDNKLWLLGSSNQSQPAMFNLYRVDPENGAIVRLTEAEVNQVAVVTDTKDGFLFQSQQSGSPQIHHLSALGERRITGIKTAAFEPEFRQGHLYFLGFKSGRYRLYRLPQERFVNESVSSVTTPRQDERWEPVLAEFAEGTVHPYVPFRTSGVRIDQIGGYLSGSGVGGIVGSASDLMRNYQISAMLVSPDNPDYSILQTNFTSQKGRATWTAGLFRVVQPRFDTVFMNQTDDNYYRHTEWGVLGAYIYPLSIFASVGVGGRLASVERGNYGDPAFSEQWRSQSRESDFLASPSVWYGYDRILYEPITGPIQGFSVLLEGGTAYYSGSQSYNNRARLDIGSYWNFFNTRTVLAFEAVGGASFGDIYRDPFVIWSDDIMRSYVYGDRRLIGNYIAAAKTELRFPVGSAFGFPNLRGLLAYDYGTITQDWAEAKENIASSASLGGSLSLPPFQLEVVQSYPIEVAPGEKDSSVLHIRLQYLYQ